MTIRMAEERDYAWLTRHDRHVSGGELASLIGLGRVYIACEGEKTIGWLRCNLFWDEIPFLNMLFILEAQRGKGIGKALLLFWEEEMRKKGYGQVMTSTSSQECSQHFYAHLGYEAVGGFMPKGEPYELILRKLL